MNLDAGIYPGDSASIWDYTENEVGALMAEIELRRQAT